MNKEEFDELVNSERGKKLIEFVKRMKDLMDEYQLNPREIHVNPSDDFVTKFDTILGLKVTKDMGIPSGKIVLL